MKRRILSMLLALSLIVSALFCFNISMVFGATNYTGNCGADGATLTRPGKNATFVYNESIRTLTISGTGAIKDYGDTVLNKRPWDDYKDQIQKVVIGEGITTIGKLNFYNCTALVDVSLPTTLTKITGDTVPTLEGTDQATYGAFRNCTALKKIVLPDGLTTIGHRAFLGCTALESIAFPDSLTSLGQYAFTECTNLKTVKYGTGLTSTGSSVFRDTGVTTIIFSPTITKVDPYCFFNTKLVDIEIPETITEIGLRSFANCDFISTVTVYNANCEYGGIKLINSGEDPFHGSAQALTMRGHSNSTTQEYAEAKNYRFESIDDCTHSNNHYEVVRPAGCVEPGSQKKVCDDCGFEFPEEEIPAVNHRWATVEISDETAQNGHVYTLRVCENCGDESTKIEHKAFVEGFYEYTNTATCTKSGIETYTCLVDGCNNVERKIALKGNHKVENYTSVTEATCTVNGSREGVCTVCNEAVVETIKATGHNNVEDHIVDSTAEDGHTYTVLKCSVCAEESTVPNHVEWLEGQYVSTVVIPAKCIINGRQRDVCTVCSETRYVEIPATGQHNWEETTRTDPDCTHVGKIYYRCINEGCTMTKSDNIPALGHELVLQKTESVAPTCTAAGYNTFKCANCAAKETTVLPALGHTVDETNYTIISEADCEHDGVAESVCTVCSVDFEIVLEKFGHNMEDDITDIEDKPGHTMNTPTCTRCGHTEPASVNHNEWIEGYYTTDIKIKPTCILSSTSVDTCTLCGKTKTNVVPATGHKYLYTNTENNGTLVYTCTICNGTDKRAPKNVSALFPTYINKNTAEVLLLGYVFDVNNDGVINAKDYAVINKAVKMSE